MLEVIINQWGQLHNKNRINTEYYAEKKANVNVCPKKCVTLSWLSCLITGKENFQIKIDFFKQTLPMSSVTGLTFKTNKKQN